MAGTLNLAKQAESGVKLFISISFINVNCDSTTGALALFHHDPSSPTNSYGLSKYEAEKECRYYLKRRKWS